jgi:hypothetical protein
MYRTSSPLRRDSASQTKLLRDMGLRGLVPTRSADCPTATRVSSDRVRVTVVAAVFGVLIKTALYEWFMITYYVLLLSWKTVAP